MSVFLQRLVIVSIVIAGIASFSVAGQQQGAAPFTAAQATAGAPRIRRTVPRVISPI